MTITTSIIAAAALIGIAIVWSIPKVYDYHTDLRNISYQLSRIADALFAMCRKMDSTKEGKDRK